MICRNYANNKMFGLLQFHSSYGKFYLNSPKGYSRKIINAQTGNAAGLGETYVQLARSLLHQCFYGRAQDTVQLAVNHLYRYDEQMLSGVKTHLVRSSITRAWCKTIVTTFYIPSYNNFARSPQINLYTV